MPNDGCVTIMSGNNNRFHGINVRVPFVCDCFVISTTYIMSLCNYYFAGLKIFPEIMYSGLAGIVDDLFGLLICFSNCSVQSLFTLPLYAGSR